MPRSLEVSLPEFIRESNHIEGLDEIDPMDQVPLYEYFLAEPYLETVHLTAFAAALTPPGQLRSEVGMDVRVGNHRPPSGGLIVLSTLSKLLLDINARRVSHYGAHHRFETLHPFTDGNGRTGRAIWLWQIKREFGCILPFLHIWYYSSLEDNRF